MIRQRINLPLTILSDAAHINIPEQYKISDGKKMMEKDLFSSQRLVNLIFLAGAPTLVPEIFYSCFFFQGEYNCVLILCIFASIQRKTEIMYRRVWDKVRENVKSNAKLPCRTKQ
ncbi:hypothetical protein HZS_3159 [Henneguya salminicola]|nr:hypothetical protein HZS_3159 [Henneguya salminicola]